MSASPFLSLMGLSVAYAAPGHRVEALLPLNLDLASGRRLAVIGESGSGKSTLALAVAGLLPAGAEVTGATRFPGLAGPPKLGRDIGIVFQDPGGSLDPVMRVGDQIAEVIVAHRGLGWGTARHEAVRRLDQVSIPFAEARARQFPHEFSGGQRQRIALAAALAADPPFLIADEPTSALDAVVQRELVTLLGDLVRERGLTLLFITHDIALASELADEVAVLMGGRLIETGPAAKVFAAPAHAYTRALLETRLDLDTPLGARLPEIEAGTFRVRRPDGTHG